MDRRRARHRRGLPLACIDRDRLGRRNRAEAADPRSLPVAAAPDRDSQSQLDARRAAADDTSTASAPKAKLAEQHADGHRARRRRTRVFPARCCDGHVACRVEGRVDRRVGRSLWFGYGP